MSSHDARADFLRDKVTQYRASCFPGKGFRFDLWEHTGEHYVDGVFVHRPDDPVERPRDWNSARPATAEQPSSRPRATSRTSPVRAVDVLPMPQFDGYRGRLTLDERIARLRQRLAVLGAAEHDHDGAVSALVRAGVPVDLEALGELDRGVAA